MKRFGEKELITTFIYLIFQFQIVSITNINSININPRAHGQSINANVHEVGTHYVGRSWG